MSGTTTLLWSLAHQLGRQAAAYVVFTVLALLLTPRDFGLVAMVMVWLNLLAPVVEGGFGVALVQRRQLEPEHASSAFTVNTIAAACLTLIIAGLSWPLAAVLNEPVVQPIAVALAVGFFFNALGWVHLAMAQRAFRFRELALRDLGASLAGGMAGIGVALANGGVWSLVAQWITSSAIGTALIWRLSGWRPTAGTFSRPHAMQLWRYGSKILAYNAFKGIVQNADQFIVGYVLGPVALGTYSFAVRALINPLTAVRGAFGAYIFPRLSQMQGNEGTLVPSYAFFVKTAAACITPLAAMAAVGAPILVPFVFGSQWATAIPVIQTLAVVAVVQSLIAPSGELMKALGRPGWLLGWSFFFSALVAAGVAVGVKWGAIGGATGLALAHVLALPVSYILVQRLIPTTAVAAATAALPPLVASSALAVAMLGILAVPGMPAAVRLIGGGLVGSACYCVVLKTLDQDLVGRLSSRLLEVARRWATA